MDIFIPMKKLIFYLVLIAFPLIGYAQNQAIRRQIESTKIALISERLALTPNEAQKFWPIYNEYNTKRNTNRKAFIRAIKNYDRETTSNQETQKLLKLRREVKEKELQLEVEYSTRMLEVINSKQLMSLYKVEHEFKKMLLHKLDQRWKHRPSHHPPPR